MACAEVRYIAVRNIVKGDWRSDTSAVLRIVNRTANITEMITYSIAIL